MPAPFFQKQALGTFGQHQAAYAGHSFHISAAMTAASAGVCVCGDQPPGLHGSCDY